LPWLAEKVHEKNRLTGKKGKHFCSVGDYRLLERGGGRPAVKLEDANHRTAKAFTIATANNKIVEGMGKSGKT